MADTATEPPAISDRIRSELEERLKELQPAVDEYHEAENMLSLITGTGSNGAPTRRRRRSRAGGKVSERFLAVVRENPGLTVSEVARKLEMGSNYLYRVAKEQEDEGNVRKDGKRYFAVSSDGGAASGE